MNGLRSKRNHILELRLGQSESQKDATLASSRNRGANAPIVVVEDDDDVQLSSPRSFAQARSSAPQRSGQMPVINEDDLELRLGFTGSHLRSCSMHLVLRGRRCSHHLVLLAGIPRHLPSHSTTTASSASGAPTVNSRTSADQNPRRKHNRIPPNKTIDLCDDSGEADQIGSKKRKHGQQLHSDIPADEAKELKLTCAICMSTMEEETSTVCGHIFCKKCITNAIQWQKKCPTCRKKLTNNNIHRIYLSSSTD